MNRLADGGQSGAGLARVAHERGAAVLKRAATGRAARLAEQARRQQEFFTHHADSPVTAPEVYATSGDSFTMRWVPGESLGDFLSRAPLPRAQRVSGLLTDWLGANLAAARPADGRPALLAKLAELRAADQPWDAVFLGDAAASFDRLEALIERSASGIPVGEAHGDLSFDNVLVEGLPERVVLLDFLDGVIDSPLLDLTRLHLDARYTWWASHGQSRNRLLLTSASLAAELEALAERAGIDPLLRQACLALTVLRILPYTESPVRRGLLLRALRRGAPVVVQRPITEELAP